MQRLAREYIGREFGPLRPGPIDNTILEPLVRDQYTETVTRDVAGQDVHLYRVHLLVMVDKDNRERLRGVWRSAEAEHRLWYVGGFAGMLMLVVGTVFTYLKLDTSTRGYYSGRLMLAAAAFLGAGALSALMLI